MQQLSDIRFIKPVWFDVILVLLACVAGSIDVMSYFEFHTFTANMTGNTILLGLSIGEGKIYIFHAFHDGAVRIFYRCFLRRIYC